MSKTFSSKSNAKRAALAEMGTSAVDGEAFALGQDADGRWNWTSLKESPGDSASVTTRPRRHPRAKGEARTSESGKGSARQGLPSPSDPPAEAQRAKAGAGYGKAGSKQAQLIAMLRDKAGATIDEIAAAFGWQRHTVRGAMAGALKKKLGLNVTSEQVEGRGRVYRIAG